MKQLVCIIFWVIPLLSIAQQQPDTTFSFTILEPAYKAGEGSTLCIDSAHNNYHTAESGFIPFAKVVEADGYRVKSIVSELVNGNELDGCDIFMVVNAMHESNEGNWTLPTPSAFTEKEILNLNEWVKEGGSLSLIADHMPFAGAAFDLGKSFGFEFQNGFATVEKEQNQPDLFTKENGRLKKSPISGEEITSLTSFTGSAFKYPESAIPVMIFTNGDFSLNPKRAWQFEENTDTISIDGYAQGALLHYGSGRVSVFGEAAMFTAQTIETPNGTFNIGMNNKEIAPQNIPFLLNLIHWLDH